MIEISHVSVQLWTEYHTSRHKPYGTSSRALLQLLGSTVPVSPRCSIAYQSKVKFGTGKLW